MEIESKENEKWMHTRHPNNLNPSEVNVLSTLLPYMLTLISSIILKKELI